MEIYKLHTVWNVYKDTAFVDMKKIKSFGDVKSFWEVYTELDEDPSECNYRYFKCNVQPTYEDPSNQKGGQWILNIPSEGLRDAFVQVLMLAVGNNSTSCDDINGIVLVNKKDKSRIEVWCKNDSERIKTDLAKLVPGHSFLFRSNIKICRNGANCSFQKSGRCKYHHF